MPFCGAAGQRRPQHSGFILSPRKSGAVRLVGGLTVGAVTAARWADVVTDYNKVVITVVVPLPPLPPMVGAVAL